MLKFNKLDRVRELAELRIDEHFATKINAILGPMAMLHARKRMLAQSGIIEDDGITEKATAQDAAIMILDGERRALKKRVRACQYSDDIQKIVLEALA